MARMSPRKPARTSARGTTASKATAPRKSDKAGSKAAAKASSSAGPQPGTKAPNFTLPRDGGGTVSLGDFAGRKLALYFYPRANTPGCTKEAIDFSRLKAAFDRAGTDVLGVSADPVKAQDAFKAKHRIGVALGSDESHDMLDAYGAWREKVLYGRKFLGVVRSTFLIGPDGRVARVWPKVSVDGHAEEVLAAAKAL